MSQKPSGYERMDGDKYYTPFWVTEALLSVESFSGDIWDTCAGGGHILDVAKAQGHRVFGIDVDPVERSDMTIAKADGLGMIGDIDNVIINPPYGSGGRLAVEFIKHALERTKARKGKVAALLRIDFDSAKTRAPIFGKHPAFAAKYALTTRIRWANLEQSAAGPTENHAWFVWDWAKRRDASRVYGYLPLDLTTGQIAFEEVA